MIDLAAAVSKIEEILAAHGKAGSYYAVSVEVQRFSSGERQVTFTASAQPDGVVVMAYAKSTIDEALGEFDRRLRKHVAAAKTPTELIADLRVAVPEVVAPRDAADDIPF